MSNKEIFENFAADFELTFKDDNWDRLRGYFAEDAFYENVGVKGQHFTGPDAILNYWKEDVSTFDRKFDSREVISLDEPKADGDQLNRSWRSVYKKEGLPDLILEGKSHYRFKDGLIQSIQAELDADFKPRIHDWMSQYGKQLV